MDTTNIRELATVAITAMQAASDAEAAICASRYTETRAAATSAAQASETAKRAVCAALLTGDRYPEWDRNMTPDRWATLARTGKTIR